ncbi:MAG TPA: DUF1826 domain-containing protein [Cyclobacteriaceae bacterium]|jgi:hypothetical protein|nr:DUF1826 domain-containing protein [Cyclobacteriaceae bacterium]
MATVFRVAQSIAFAYECHTKQIFTYKKYFVRNIFNPPSTRVVNKWLNELVGKKQIHQVEVDDLNSLAQIHREDVNLAYFKREVDDDIESFARHLIQCGFKGISERVSRETISSIVNDKLNEAGLYTIGKVKLIQDISRIARIFFTITQSHQIKLILKVVGDDACRKFHTDAYDLRVLCTYVGSGTEWIADQFVNRRKLVSGTNEEIIRDFSKVQQTEPFEIAILKGEVKSKPNGKGIVHRSPPIQHIGGKRLLLRLDF